MPGTVNAGPNRALPVLRTASAIGASEATIIEGIAIRGWGTVRVALYADQEVTFKVYTKPRRLSSSSLVTYRQFASRTVAAGGRMEPLIFNVHSDLIKITAQPTGAVPTVFECGVNLHP